MLGPRTETSGPPHQEQKLTHNLGVGPQRELGLLEEWEEGPLGSWLIASPPLPAMEMVFQTE